MERIVVVGGSLAGVEAAAALRRDGYAGLLTVIAEEHHEPYERYPLSKDFLTKGLDASEIGLDAVLCSDVEMLAEQEAVNLDCRDRYVTLRGWARLPFDGLVIATGSRPRRLPWTRDLAGVYYFRTLDDALLVRAALDTRPEHVVVVGGGLIGSEVVSAVTARGLAVTLVDMSQAPLERTVGPVVAAHLLEAHVAHGVHILTGTKISDASTEGEQVREIELESGECLAADLVIVAAGTIPNVEWLRSSGLHLEDGVLCDATLHAVGATDIVAAGDVARTSYALLDGEAVRVEHWRNAIEQGRRAASNLLRGPRASQPFDATPCYGTSIQGNYVRVAGLPQYGDETVIAWGSISSSRYVAAVGRRGCLVGTLAVNTPDEVTAHYTALVEASARELRRRTPAEPISPGSPKYP
ncbi:MAG: FAD-dependent oxidoreductase [Actinomycetota bacterium]|nr:FAD-dependent oxidoreductase [Actinomycetota bacterium]